MHTDQFIGQTFGSLTVTARYGAPRSSQWECTCVCGATVVCRIGNLRQKRGTACGCALRLRGKNRETTHGRSRSREYGCWGDMITRCTNPKTKSFARYGARGIAVCDKWLQFDGFFEDMGAAPSPEHSIDRIDNDGPYSPENCRWATRQEQANNKSNNRILTFNGESAPMSEWARRSGISADTIERRLNKLGWDTDKAISTPVRPWSPGRPKPL